MPEGAMGRNGITVHNFSVWITLQILLKTAELGVSSLAVDFLVVLGFVCLFVLIPTLRKQNSNDL